jgi:hypothetical protein
VALTFDELPRGPPVGGLNTDLQPSEDFEGSLRAGPLKNEERDVFD